jgi:hypothetical protein
MALDPIIADIRAVRERIAAECDYDFHKMCQRGEETLRQWKGRVMTEEELRRQRNSHAHPNKG